MFTKPFSNDADRLLGLAYGLYLQKRKSGKSKSESMRIRKNEQDEIQKALSWVASDFVMTLRELSQAGLITTYLTGGFDLTTNAIVYMENKPRETISEIINTVAKFIP